MPAPATDPLLFLPESACSGRERQALVSILRRRRRTPMVEQLWEASGDGALNRPPREWAGPLLERIPGQTMAPWQDRWIACWLVGRMGLEGDEGRRAVEVLADVIDEKVGGPRGPLERSGVCRGIARSIRASILPAAPLAAYQTLTIYQTRSVSNPVEPLLLGCAIWGGFAVLLGLALSPAFVVASVAGDLRVRKAAATALGRIGTLDCIPPLVRAALGRQRGARAASVEALRSLLPGIPPSAYPEHAADLSPALRKLLRHPDTALVLLALDAVEKAGDGSCLSAVRRRAEFGRADAVRQRAAALLALLQARRESERLAATLLRPAEPDAASTLLRAAPSSPTDPELLLRPAESDDQG